MMSYMKKSFCNVIKTHLKNDVAKTNLMTMIYGHTKTILKIDPFVTHQTKKMQK